MPLTVQSLTVTHGSGVGGCKILRQWRVSDLNFFRGKLRIFITFQGHGRDSLKEIHAYITHELYMS
jgi:hypothetical protein